ncbi:MAG: mutL [Chloroflexi bacterium]|nr:mutL [Chloroflexota bacterium]
MTIRILPPEVASQIAAGEVVERPASVVKELVENALDASADTITIEIKDAGRRLVEVADNGNGIPCDELDLAVERHATSKLDRASDLFQIKTLGFRGEALASIGSVSHMSITSRTSSMEAGARLVVDGGLANAIQWVGAPVGTLVRVEDLFFNVPARLKFLKHDTTERRQIDNLVTRYALAYPHARFTLHQEDRLALQTSGNGDRREILAVLYGPDVARQMLTVITEDENIHIDGFISPTSLTRSNRRDITFFVNGRPVFDAALTAAILKAYHTLLMVGRYPQAILFVNVPPETVDVNVHPTKAEVRFRDSERIFSAVQRAVRRALLVHTPIPGINETIRWAPSSTPGDTDPGWQISKTEDKTLHNFHISTTPPVEMRQPYTEAQGPADKTSTEAVQSGLRVPILRLIGQLATTYLAAEGPDGLYLIDQHAAHERVLFEQLMAQRDQPIPAQNLLQPVTIHLPPAEARLLSEQLQILGRLGFQVEPFGPNTFLIRAIPNILTGSDPVAAVRVLVEDFEEDETPLQSEVEARIIARICKRAAVKAGKVLSGEEQHVLLENLENCQSPRTCPHGRPTMIHLSVDLLERQFGRRGAR